MENYFVELLKAGSLFLKVGIILIAYWLANEFSLKSKKPSWKIYLHTFFVVIGLAIISAYSLGTYTDTSDYDPMFGGGNTVVEYEPSTQQQIQKALFVFIVLIVPSIIGVHKGINDRTESNDNTK
ncbi:MAG: hypothetical protein HGB12_16425 [Bacteroidetes bacterium]|nr:hypothetical protein [Bacteroidota bacterium]